MNEAYYFPFLKTKRGEAKALQNLTAGIKANIRPFFDVLALEGGIAHPSQVQAHLVKQCGMVAIGWKNQGPCYVDLYDVRPEVRAEGGVHPLQFVMSSLLALNVNPIPVIGLGRDLAYQLSFRSLMAMEPPAICIRLEQEDLMLHEGLAERIENLVSALDAWDLPLHIVADFRGMRGNTANAGAADVLYEAMTEIRSLNPACIVFSGSGMVDSMGVYKRNSINRLPRIDFQAWQSLVVAGVRDVRYGDYGVVHPDYVDLDPRVIKPSAKIRYATAQEWVIVKGSSWRDNTSQHRELSQALIAVPGFRGDDSWGGNYIVSAAAGRPTYGSLETWVTIDQNAHATFTTRSVVATLLRAGVLPAAPVGII